MSINKRKFFIIIGALIVIGVATGAVLYYAYPVQMDTIGGLTRNYIVSSTQPGTITTEMNAAYKAAEGVVASSDNDGIECGLQSALTSRRGAIGERHCRRLAELQPNSHFGSLLAAQRDQYEECRPAQGLVHLRRR